MKYLDGGFPIRYTQSMENNAAYIISIRILANGKIVTYEVTERSIEHARWRAAQMFCREFPFTQPGDSEIIL